MTQSFWLARDKDGFLTVFENKPEREDEKWVDFYSETVKQFIFIDNSLFPNLKWEDEPIEVNIFTKEFVQKFGDACYKQGQSDACSFEYGREEDGNLYIEDFIAQNEQ